jgi:hypothetical protein
MKVLIVGDSYVNNFVPTHLLSKQNLSNKQHIRFKDNHPYYSWTSHLSEVNPDFQITSLGEGGCDNWWIYSTFLANYKNYDKVIITWTADSRYSWQTEDGVWFHTSNVASAKHKYEMEETNRHLYKTMIDFLPQVHFEDVNRYRAFNRLMLDNIKLLKHDTMFINCFNPNDTHFKDNEQYNNCLFAITQYENKQMGIKGFANWKDPDLDEKLDCRHGHITRSSHIILGKQIASAVERGVTEFNIKIDSFKREMTENDYKEFWTRRDILKYAEKYYS